MILKEIRTVDKASEQLIANLDTVINDYMTGRVQISLYHTRSYQ